jgi:hypothetical protein
MRLAVGRIKIAFTENHQTLLIRMGQLEFCQEKRGIYEAIYRCFGSSFCNDGWRGTGGVVLE